MSAHLDLHRLNAIASDVVWQGPDRRNGARHIWFLNAAFDRISADVALKRIAERPAKKPFAFVVTPNVDHLVRLQGESVLARLYAQAWLTVQRFARGMYEERSRPAAMDEVTAPISVGSELS